VICTKPRRDADCADGKTNPCWFSHELPLKQIAANRRNALKSTGPVTAEGKERSRYNAVRHRLTAETVIDALEFAEGLSFGRLALAIAISSSCVDATLMVARSSVVAMAEDQGGACPPID
jgi:hypothetical protein